MGYVVIHDFSDIQDKYHQYQAGDKYPRSGLRPKKARIEELSGSDNKRKQPLIKEE